MVEEGEAPAFAVAGYINLNTNYNWNVGKKKVT